MADEKMQNIMLLATAWGSKHGGINAFNMDFAHGLVDYLKGTGQVFCSVFNASREDHEDAQRHGVTLLPINKPTDSPSYDNSWGYEVWKTFHQIYPDRKIDWWVAHDVISGAAAVEGPAASNYGRTAVIMHMSYIDYASYKHGSGVNAVKKDQQQRKIFKQAHKHFAVGPLLYDAMRDIVGDNVTMLVPGFATITSNPSKAHLNLITFGRMDRESDRIKQGTLAVAGFASACRMAHELSGLPPELRDNPHMRVIGIAQAGNDEEHQLRQLAEQKAGRVMMILAQPFTENRDELFDQLGRANLALMLSWHEGFGLTGWEAIAAQVPLIISRQSGLYRLVKDNIGDHGIACLKVLDIRGREGSDDSTNFLPEDEGNVRDAILEMVRDLKNWQKNAAYLKCLLEQKLECTWVHTAKQFCEALGIDVHTRSDAFPSLNTPVDKRPMGGAKDKLVESPALEQDSPFRNLAERLVLENDIAVLQGLPIERMGRWISVDPIEAESMRSIRNIIREYIVQSQRHRLLNFAVFAPPGVGKSFPIMEMIRELSDARIQELSFDVSHFNTENDLVSALEKVRDCAIKQMLPLIFWEKFDTARQGQPLGWLAQFLALMQDSRFDSGGVMRPIGRAIFIFTGSMYATMAQFRDHAASMPAVHMPEFISFLHGFVDIIGPNPFGSTDKTCALRRAIFLRSLLERNAPRLISEGRIKIEMGVLRAFLYVSTFIYGIRSMDSIINMSSLAGKTRYRAEDLPAPQQLSLHVNAEEFLTLSQQQPSS